MLSSKILEVIPLTCVPFGVLSEDGACHVRRVPMREMSAHMGSPAGDSRRRAEGLSKMQESVLEHASEETAREDAQGLTDVNLTTRLPQSNPLVNPIDEKQVRRLTL
jgi:hypothetical protein